ncbi:hypothetical protein TrRE_jg11435 [Triparma retinervis]|uniref:Malic enzyme n=1 Tax=Triparma retinervis TaxID=2557542 RepID=A0A9W7G2Y7_9STRA|nr:hypothetical protein TrRE_jg11435 [Triparma retinervis]
MMFGRLLKSGHLRSSTFHVRPLSTSDHNFNFSSLRKFKAPLQVPKRGVDILHDPLFNKGTAFKPGERDRLRFRGLLPPRRLTMEMQGERVMQEIKKCSSAIEQNKKIEDLHDRNETLYHRLLVDNIKFLAPIIYTPTGIPIGKLSLYCAAGGIAPHRVLPVTIDVGTDNKELLDDPFYLGLKEPRLKGKDYFCVVDEFMQAVKHRWPNCLVQFEDFNSSVAQPLLNNYRDTHLCFNDDIQGTGATTLAGCLGALRAAGKSVDSLGDQRIMIAGAGSAGIGVAQVLRQAMVEQGVEEGKAKDCFFIADEHGLLTEDREDLNDEQRAFARKEGRGMSLQDIAEEHSPTILLGLTAFGGLFKEELIRTMASKTSRPIIFPLSNPTTAAECTASQAYSWTDGRCVFASGSPFDPVTHSGRTYTPTQCNNMFVFPGIGLGATVCGAKSVTDRMLYVSARALAEYLTEEELEEGKVFPQVEEIRNVSHKVACAVIREAWDTGNQSKLGEKEMGDLENFVWSKMYDPQYVPIVEKPA